MSPWIWTGWYLYVNLYKNKKHKPIGIHRIVAIVFHRMDANNKKLCACHKDDDKTNNREDNIFVWTMKDNMDDMIKKWRDNKQRISILQFDMEWNFISEWSCGREIEKNLWISATQISQCCRSKEHYNSAWWFVWKFKFATAKKKI